MTSVVVLSDTHSLRLPDIVTARIDACDLIIHAGDFSSVDYFEYMQSFGKEIIGVMGNMDVVPLSSLIPVRRLFTVESIRIALMHGWGAPAFVEESVRMSFHEDEWDVLIYGHTHYPIIRRDTTKIILNPGSPSDKRFAPYKSFAELKIDGAICTECSIIPL